MSLLLSSTHLWSFFFKEYFLQANKGRSDHSEVLTRGGLAWGGKKEKKINGSILVEDKRLLGFNYPPCSFMNLLTTQFRREDSLEHTYSISGSVRLLSPHSKNRVNDLSVLKAGSLFGRIHLRRK